MRSGRLPGMVAMTLAIDDLAERRHPDERLFLRLDAGGFQLLDDVLARLDEGRVPDGRGPKATCLLQVLPRARAVERHVRCDLSFALGATFASLVGATCCRCRCTLLSSVGAIAFAVSVHPVAGTQNAPTRSAAARRSERKRVRTDRRRKQSSHRHAKSSIAPMSAY